MNAFRTMADASTDPALAIAARSDQAGAHEAGSAPEIAPSVNVTTGGRGPRGKTKRDLNEVDFWRGFALISIYVNHVPGIFFEAYTFRNFGLSDSAELFVFLAGFSLRYLSESRSENLTTARLFMRLEGRAFTLYAAQTLITVLALAALAQAALTFDTPLLLEWNNSQAFFQEPVTTIIGMALLTHQLGYFDILPLYIILMMAAPFIVLLHRWKPVLVLPLSILIWAVTLTFEINFSTWPVEGRWFFDPLAWQLCFVLGFIMAKPSGLGALVRRHGRTVRTFGFVVVTLGLAIRVFEWDPDAFAVPTPHLFFVFDKTFLSPGRLIHMLGLAALFTGLFGLMVRFTLGRGLGLWLSLLGRNSLHVFCAGSLLSLAGQITRFALQISFATDLAIMLVGFMAMTLVAWLNEWRVRL